MKYFFEKHPNIRTFVINTAATFLGGLILLIVAGPHIPSRLVYVTSEISEGKQKIDFRNKGIMNFSGDFIISSADVNQPIESVRVERGQQYLNVLDTHLPHKKIMKIANLPISHDIVAVVQGPQKINVDQTVFEGFAMIKSKSEGDDLYTLEAGSGEQIDFKITDNTKPFGEMTKSELVGSDAAMVKVRNNSETGEAEAEYVELVGRYNVL